MTWPDVEFLDPAGLPLVDEPDPPPDGRRVPARILFALPLATALLGWIVAGALALLASFRLAYSVTFANAGEQTVRFSVDGWGREQVPNNASTFGEHGARSGIAFSAAVGLIVVLVVLAIWHAWRGATHVRQSRLMTALAVVVPSILAAVTVTEWLTIDSVLSGYRAIDRQNAANESTGTAGPSAIHTHVGPSVWLAVAAAACAVIASALYLLPRRRAVAPSAPSQIDAEIDAEVDRGGELQLDDAELLA